MTRDVTKELTPETFTVKIRGIDGRRSTAASYDPIADRNVPLDVVSTAADELTLRLPATDYPWLLILEEGEGRRAKPSEN